jgi:hypothetical protein
MISLMHLWLPILLSAVGVFIASSILHMVLKFWHMPDYHGFSNEDEVRSAIRKSDPAPGMYMLPMCRMEDMKTPETQEKFKQGPVGLVMLRANGIMNMGTSLLQWFIFCLLVSYFCAYLAASTLGGGTAGLQVFRVVGTAGIMAYAFGSLPQGIWMAQPWNSVIKAVIDGIIYGLITAAVFAWLWPK